MKGFFTRLTISALSLGAAAHIVPGIYIDNIMTLLIAAFLLGIVNAIIRPVLIVLTLPVTLVSLGLFLLVVNAAMLGLVAWILDGFAIAGFFSALFGWLILSLTSWAASRIFINENSDK